jgi:hypothetical protein
LKKLHAISDPKADKHLIAVNKQLKIENEKIRERNANRIAKAITENIEKFTNKYGNAPTFAIVRAEECDGFEFDLPVIIQKAVNNCPPGHFYLGPIIKRHPRVVEKRIPWLTQTK